MTGMKTGRTVVLLSAALFLLAVLGACGSKVNQDNFDRVQVGMTFEEVRKILGPATESSSVQIGDLSGTSASWVSEEGRIQIQFLNDKVKIKQFTKP